METSLKKKNCDCAGSSLLLHGLSLIVASGAPLPWGARAPHSSDFSCYRAQALEWGLGRCGA